MRLRSVRLLAGLLALLVAIAGCGFVTAPVPANTVPIQLGVDNDSVREGTIEVRRTSGAARLIHSVSVPARSTTRVTLHVPLEGDWVIVANGGDMLGPPDLRGQLGDIRNIGILISEDGTPSWWCRGVCP